jgi:hypothetical protein
MAGLSSLTPSGEAQAWKMLALWPATGLIGPPLQGVAFRCPGEQILFSLLARSLEWGPMSVEEYEYEPFFVVQVSNSDLGCGRYFSAWQRR